MRSISPLPAHVAAQLKSSVDVVSLHDVVIELVKNSLDAGSSRIDVTVDFARGSCSVEDDGEGISSDEFGPHGGLAKPFHTSKQDLDSANHGCYGTFLAALGAVSVVSILSRHHPETHGSSVTIHKSQHVAVNAGNVTDPCLQNRRHGTWVQAQDLFGNMPVRVMQRPTGDDSKPTRDRMWRNLCNDLLGILLAWRRRVALNVECQDNEHIFRARPPREGSVPVPVSRVGDSDGMDVARLCHLLSLAHSDGSNAWSVWVRTVARGEGLVVRGLISKHGSPSRSTQFISLGIHHLLRPGHLQSLYDAANSVFAQSNFGLRFAKASETTTQVPDARSGGSEENVDRHPMYYICIEPAVQLGLPTVQPAHLTSKDVAKITDMVKAMIVGFLQNQKLNPREHRKRVRSAKISSADAHSSVRKCRSLPLAITEWGRMRKGLPARASKRSIEDLGRSSQLIPHRDISSASSNGQPILIDGTELTSLSQEAEPTAFPAEDNFISCIEPKTGQQVRINARTGMEEQEPSRAQMSQLPGPEPAVVTGSGKAKARLTFDAKDDRSEQSSGEADAWAESIARSWKNPVFPQPEEPISAVICDSENFSRADQTKEHSTRTGQDLEVAFCRHIQAAESKITRDDLLQAEAISQVDDKFILAKVAQPDSNHVGKPSSIIIIDQHAADERIRVEDLLSQLCQPSSSDQIIPGHPYQSSINSVILESPLMFSIRGRELELLEHDAPYFASWGILFAIRCSAHCQHAGISQPVAVHQLIVLSLPPVIAERCRSSPELLRSLLLDEAWRRDERGTTQRLEVSNEQDSDDQVIEDTCPGNDTQKWLRRIDKAPRGLLDLINSRACRSAIMFNDKLDIDQCRDLIERLALTVSPFVCAHGRPSMLPLASLITDKTTETGSSQSSERVSFGQAWTRWDP